MQCIQSSLRRVDESCAAMIRRLWLHPRWMCTYKSPVEPFLFFWTAKRIQVFIGSPSSDRTTWVTSSPLTQRMHPLSTFETWNIVFTRASLAPPSQKITWPIHHWSLSCWAVCCCAWTITQSPVLTLRNVGAFVPSSGLTAGDKWSVLTNTSELLF